MATLDPQLVKVVQRFIKVPDTGVVDAATVKAVNHYFGLGPPSPGATHGGAVWIQSRLNQVVGAGLRVDGIAGPLTRAAIRKFQHRAGLAADGVAGPLTMTALRAPSTIATGGRQSVKASSTGGHGFWQQLWQPGGGTAAIDQQPATTSISAKAASTGTANVVKGAAIPAVSSGGITITFGRNANSQALTAFSRAVLQDILLTAGISRVQISSTERSPDEQARVMYDNLVSFGVKPQKHLYRAGGGRVIDAYVKAKADGLSADAIRERMVAMIYIVGPTHVSRHASDPRQLNVFDVAPSSVSHRSAFEHAVRSDRRVSRFLTPADKDPGYHLEIPQR